MGEITELLQYNLTLKEPYFETVQIACITPKKTSEAIHFLAEKYPLSNYNLCHLKRAKKSQCKSHIQILIAPVEDIEELSDLDPFIHPCENCPTFSLAKVPKIPPYTKSQLATWSLYWNCCMVQPSVIPYSHTSEETTKIQSIIQKIPPGHASLYNFKLDFLRSPQGCGTQIWQHPVFQAIQDYQVRDDEYLCTETYAFAYEEPCIMCAMALVHSRIIRLYFSKASEDGAFSKWKLHERSVNYMYRVFQISV